MLISIYANKIPECFGNIFQEALEIEKAEGTSTPTIMIDNPLPIFFLPTSITHKLSFHLVNYCCAGTFRNI